MEIKENNKVRSPLIWFGGKGRFVKNLLPLIPEHEHYLEVFGGGGSFLFAKDKCKHEIYNDIDGDLVNFFRVIREPAMFGQFYHRVVNTLYARSEFNWSRDHLRLESDPIMRAYYFFVVNRQSFSGTGEGWRHDTQNSQNLHGLNAILEMFPRIHERLRGIYVEQNDFRRIFEIYTYEKFFVYLDPPYVWSTRKHGRYKNEMSDEDHKDLVKIILEYPGMVMLSGYEHDIYKPLVEAGWDLQKFEVKCTCSNGRTFKKQGDRVECVWRNAACLENGRKKQGSLKFEV